MDLIDRFIPYKLPRQYIYFSEQGLRIFIPDRKNREFTPRDVPSINFLSPPFTPESILELKTQLAPVSTGLILNPYFFIYNLFNFERIPFKNSTRREIVEWKLEKIFPEKIENYHHLFYKIDSRTILSILIRKEWIDQFESVFQQCNIPVTFIGNSTIEIINHLFHSKRPPDFFIEYDRTSVLLAFQKRKKLIFLRKFRVSSDTDLLEEIHKTLNFVSSQYPFVPKTFSLVSTGISIAPEGLTEKIQEWNLSPIATPDHSHSFLPVAS